MPVNNKAIGRNIRNARKAQGMTQEKLAECMGVSSAYIGKLERGERTANLDNLSELANILTVPIESLVQGSVPIKNDGQLPNDFLDAVVSDTDSQFDQIDPKDIDKHIVNLQNAMKALLA